MEARLSKEAPKRFHWESGVGVSLQGNQSRTVLAMHVFIGEGGSGKGKRYPRFIHLHGPALEIVRRLMAVRTAGKQFRITRGEAWTKSALCNRMYRLSRMAGVKKTAYDMRHGFATRKLVQGHDHLTIAELMGHRDGRMLAKVYAHLDRNDAHLKKALED